MPVQTPTGTDQASPQPADQRAPMSPPETVRRASSEAPPSNHPTVQQVMAPKDAPVPVSTRPSAEMSVSHRMEALAQTPARSAQEGLAVPVDAITPVPVAALTIPRASSESASERGPLPADIAQCMEAASRRPLPEPADIVSLVGRMQRAGELLGRRFASDQELSHRTVPPELAAAQQRLQAVLDGMQLDPTQNADEQRELKRLYIKENAPIEAAWRVLYGERYVPGQSMQAPFAEGLLNAAFEFARGGFSSLMRSPARNGAATELRPRPGDQLTVNSVHTVDANALGGAVGGLGAYLFEKAIEPAMLKQAEKTNLPALVPVPPELLAPPPGRVRQTSWRSEDGTHMVRFHIAGVKDEAGRFEDGLRGASPHLPKLDSETQQKRESIAMWQQAWNAEHYGALTQPFLTACLNSLQPVLLSEQARDSGGSVFSVSAFGSATAGALASGSLNLAKAMPYLGQVQVKDAMNRPQRLNMFIPVGRNLDPSVDMARWRDVLHLPGAALKAVGGTVVEAAKLPKELVLDPLHAIPDLLMRHVLPNVLVGVAAPATTDAALEPLKSNPTLSAFENAGSWLGRTRVGLTSGLNDYLWPTLRDKMAPLKAKTDVRRKERRDIQAADRTRLEANREIVVRQLLDHQLRLPPLLRATGAGTLPAQDREFIGEIASAERLRVQDAPRLRHIADQLPGDAELARELRLLAQGVEQRARIDSRLAPPWSSRFAGSTRNVTASTSPA